MSLFVAHCNGLKTTEELKKEECFEELLAIATVEHESTAAATDADDTAAATNQLIESFVSFVPVLDKDTKLCRGFAFASFLDEEGRASFIEMFNGKRIIADDSTAAADTATKEEDDATALSNAISNVELAPDDRPRLSFCASADAGMTITVSTKDTKKLASKGKSSKKISGGGKGEHAEIKNVQNGSFRNTPRGKSKDKHKCGTSARKITWVRETKDADSF
jgi:hypothetical protein